MGIHILTADMAVADQNVSDQCRQSEQVHDVVLEVGQLQGLAMAWTHKLHVLTHIVDLKLIEL